MFKLYMDAKKAERQWIREHPFQYVAVNATIIAGVLGFTWLQDRRAQKKFVAEEPTLMD